MILNREAKGLFFEDIAIGQSTVTQTRTITETDIVQFSYLTGDWNEIHSSAIYAQTTPFKRRIAHGLLTLAVSSGLNVLTGLFDGTVVAFLGLDWKFKNPVYAGDTIQAHTAAVSKKLMPGGDAGHVKMEIKVTNQDGKLVQRGFWSAMVMTRQGKAKAVG